MSAPIKFVPFCEVLGLRLTPSWRVLLLVSIDGVPPSRLEGEDRAIAGKLFGAGVDEVPGTARRVICWRLGRASGKTTLAAALILWCALTVDLSRCGPGQLPAAFIVSPTSPLAKIALGVARELLRLSPLERLVVDEQDTTTGFSIRRPDGRLVAVRSVAASKGGQNLRGVDVVTLVLDESEFFASGEAAVTDSDQIAAVMPRLLGFVLAISTPWPTPNATADFIDRNWGAPKDATAAIGPSMFMRPTPELALDIERETIRDPENASREFECVPGPRGTSRLFVEGLDEAVDKSRPLVTFAPAGAAVGCGGDLGLEKDSSAIAVVSNLDGAFALLEVDEVRPTPGNPLAPRHVLCDRFAPVMRRHGVTSITMDAHYRQSAAEHLNAEGLDFERAPEGNQGKYDSFMFVRGLLRAGQLRLPNVPRLLSQMRNITTAPMERGLTKITSPRRAGQAGHGDTLSALVLGIWAARDSGESDWGRYVNAFAASGGRGIDAVASEKPPLACLYHYTGMHEIYGNEPKFNTRMRVIFTHQNDEGRWSSAATEAFRAAVGEYRRSKSL